MTDQTSAPKISQAVMGGAQRLAVLLEAADQSNLGPLIIPVEAGPQIDLLASLRLVQAELAIASEVIERFEKQGHVFDQFWEEAEDPSTKRSTIFGSFGSTMLLLTEIVGRDVARPLEHLFAALQDLDRGIASPIFEKRPTPGGRPPGSHIHDSEMGTACALVDLISSRTVTIGQAHAIVAARVGIDVEALRNWRKQLSSGRKSEVARDAYESTKAAAARFRDGQAAFVEVVLERISVGFAPR